MKSTQVIAVIVVFQPELEALYQLVLATAEQVEGIVIVNNSPKVSLNEFAAGFGEIATSSPEVADTSVPSEPQVCTITVSVAVQPSANL